MYQIVKKEPDFWLFFIVFRKIIVRSQLWKSSFALELCMRDLDQEQLFLPLLRWWCSWWYMLYHQESLQFQLLCLCLSVRGAWLASFEWGYHHGEKAGQLVVQFCFLTFWLLKGYWKLELHLNYIEDVQLLQRILLQYFWCLGMV